MDTTAAQRCTASCEQMCCAQEGLRHTVRKPLPRCGVVTLLAVAHTLATVPVLHTVLRIKEREEAHGGGTYL